MVDFSTYPSLVNNNIGAKVFKDLTDNRGNTMERYINIVSNNGQHACILKVQLATTAPLYQTPTATIDSKGMIDITITKNKYGNNYKFLDFQPYNYNNTIEDYLVSNRVVRGEFNSYVDEVIEEWKNEFAALGAGNNESRYVEILSLTNPLTQSDYTIFLDRLHKDLFVITGLGLFLDSNIDFTDNKIIPITGIKIGGSAFDDFNKPIYSTIPTTKDNMLKIDGCVDNANEIGNDNIYVKAVTFTRDLPANIANTNYPVFYDKLQHINGTEIQLARQDTIPIMWVNLGPIHNYITSTKAEFYKTSYVKVPNFVIYNQSPNIYRFIYNGTKHDINTQFGIALPIY